MGRAHGRRKDGREGILDGIERWEGRWDAIYEREVRDIRKGERKA